MGLDTGDRNVKNLNVDGDLIYEDLLMHKYEKYEFISDDKTLDAEDCGKTLIVIADAKTITLPATVVGYYYRIVNGVADGGALVTVDPNGSDNIEGIDYTGADGGAATNTKATAKRGDFIELIGDGDAGWYVVKCAGTWVIAES